MDSVICPEYLCLCVDFAFYINKNGWRSRPGWIIHWEGTPTSFGETHIASSVMGIVGLISFIFHLALSYPYVLAFEPTFIEIRHVETGLMAQVIAGTMISCLFADSPPSADSAAPPQQHLPPAPPQHMMHGYGGPPGHPHQAMTIGNRQSMYSPYGQPPRQSLPAPNPRRDHHKRDEIILSMDDKVMGLRRAPPPKPDNASTYSTVPSYATLPR